MTQTADWYGAVVRDCSLSPDSFQLANGNIPLGTVSTALWSMLDVVPPDSIENYNPDPGSVFSSVYGAVLLSLKDSPLVMAAQKAWNDNGGFLSVKAYDKTIEDLTAAITHAPGKKVTMTVGSGSTGLGSTWASSSEHATANLFRRTTTADDEISDPAPPPGTIVEVTFDHVLTFVSGPLSKFDPFNLGLNQFKPWYIDAALKIALSDRTAWTDPANWRFYFGPNMGSLLRRITSLVVVDGVATITRLPSAPDLCATPSSLLETPRQYDGPIGFWPFDTPPLKAFSGPSNRLESDAEGDTNTFTFNSKPGNPLLLGVNVKSLIASP